MEHIDLFEDSHQCKAQNHEKIPLGNWKLLAIQDKELGKGN